MQSEEILLQSNRESGIENPESSWTIKHALLVAWPEGIRVTAAVHARRLRHFAKLTILFRQHHSEGDLGLPRPISYDKISHHP